jgi:hypothetical protein
MVVDLAYQVISMEVRQKSPCGVEMMRVRRVPPMGQQSPEVRGELLCTAQAAFGVRRQPRISLIMGLMRYVY